MKTVVFNAMPKEGSNDNLDLGAQYCRYFRRGGELDDHELFDGRIVIEIRDRNLSKNRFDGDPEGWSVMFLDKRTAIQFSKHLTREISKLSRDQAYYEAKEDEGGNQNG